MEHSQNRVRMTWRWKTVAHVMIGIWLMAGAAQASGDAMALRLRDNVVRIATHFVAQDDRWNDQGFGFIVGERSGKAVIITANHVVRGKHPRPDQRSERINVTYYGDQGRAYKADLLGTFTAKLDLAVIEVKLPNGVQWHKDALDRGENIRRGTEVWYVGRSGKWHVPTTPGKINDEALGGMFTIDDLSVRPGTSGAPVVSSNGILGMVITDSTGSESQAVSIDILRKASKRWNLPWHLDDAISQDNGGQIRPDTSTDIGTQTAPLHGPDISGTWSFQIGNYMFGSFVPTGAGYFIIQKTRANQYQFQQYTSMNQLESTGEIEYDDEDGLFYLDGMMTLIGAYSAELAYIDGQLVGTALMQGAESVVILGR